MFNSLCIQHIDPWILMAILVVGMAAEEEEKREMSFTEKDKE